MHRISCTIFLLYLFSFSTICHAVDFVDCGSEIGKYTSVSISGCDVSRPACDLILGTNVTITIDFTSDVDCSQITAIVHGIIMNVPIPFPIPMSNVCHSADSGITCPLHKGGPYRYQATLPVYKNYPKVSVNVKWELKNEEGKDIVCVIIPTKIK